MPKPLDIPTRPCIIDSIESVNERENMKKTISVRFTQSELNVIYDALSEYNNMIYDALSEYNTEIDDNENIEEIIEEKEIIEEIIESIESKYKLLLMIMSL